MNNRNGVCVDVESGLEVVDDSLSVHFHPFNGLTAIERIARRARRDIEQLHRISDAYDLPVDCLDLYGATVAVAKSATRSIQNIVGA